MDKYQLKCLLALHEYKKLSTKLTKSHKKFTNKHKTLWLTSQCMQVLNQILKMNSLIRKLMLIDTLTTIK